MDLNIPHGKKKSVHQKNWERCFASLTNQARKVRPYDQTTSRTKGCGGRNNFDSRTCPRFFCRLSSIDFKFALTTKCISNAIEYCSRHSKSSFKILLWVDGLRSEVQSLKMLRCCSEISSLVSLPWASFRFIDLAEVGDLSLCYHAIAFMSSSWSKWSILLDDRYRLTIKETKSTSSFPKTIQKKNYIILKPITHCYMLHFLQGICRIEFW